MDSTPSCRRTRCTRGLGTLLAGLLLLAALAPTARALTTEALLDTLQHTAFDFFWTEANPANGLIKDRSTPASPCSIAAVGFGLSAICIGIDHGWVTRAAGRERVLTTLKTFWNGPQGFDDNGNIGYKGLFYHFLDMNTGTRVWDCELSTIDTALLLAGRARCEAVLHRQRSRRGRDPGAGGRPLPARGLGVHAQLGRGHPHGLEAG